MRKNYFNFRIFKTFAGDTLLSSSRDKSVILWHLQREENGPNGAYGYPRRSLRGHSHFVEDVVISSDGQARSPSKKPSLFVGRRLDAPGRRAAASGHVALFAFRSCNVPPCRCRAACVHIFKPYTFRSPACHA